MKSSLFVLSLSLSLLVLSCRQPADSWTLNSPDQNIRIEISQHLENESLMLYYSISMVVNGSFEEIIDPSPLGIDRTDGRFIENLEFVSTESQDHVVDNYTLKSGKQLTCVSTYNELTLSFKNSDKKNISLNFRAYDDGIAFRYGFSGPSQEVLTVTGEATGFNFKEGNFWGHPYDTLSVYTPAYETYYQGPLEVGTAAPWNKNGWAFPLLIESGGVWMLVSEAGHDGSYGASHLEQECEQGSYLIRFAEQGEAEGYYDNTSAASLPWLTPWRFIVVGESLHQIVETTLPTDLSPISKLGDTSWIKPGRASWSWWSDSDSPQDYNRLVPFVDLAARMGWEYSLVDANWNHMKNGTIEKLVSYADSKGVGLLLWYNSGGIHNVVPEEPRNLMDNRKARRAEFERISAMGIKGVKVDFFQSDKQKIIAQYLEILEDAASYKLLVNFHGCTLPKGWRRTWPNLVSMEAVRGEECYKFDGLFPEKAPGNMAILPFTRNAIGPVDYTPGGYTDHFYPHLTSYGFELAVPIILESGIMHHSDTPEKTLELPSYAVDFLKKLPVVWDETRYVTGYPGKEVVLARRHGEDWYLAGVNGEPVAKELSIDLSGLGQVPDKIAVITDGSSARDLQPATLEVRGGKITLQMQAYGGFVGSWD